jgi:DNA-3-methyladenine glycosylase I
MPRRCPWAGTDPVMVDYHDREWGVPLRDPDRLFELLCLEGAQAGLAWITILRKRDGYRRAFADFDARTIASYGDDDRARLLADASIVRNRAKVDAFIRNARVWLTVPDPADLLWSFVGGRTSQNRWTELADVPAATDESTAMSKTLRGLGFGFVGPTITYAFMQSAGMVNDHLVDCFRYRELGGDAKA